MRRDDDGYPAPVDLDDARPVLVAQGAYYAATGLLPFASRRAFEAVTGPKREWWLVQTVRLLVTVVGGALLSGARGGPPAPRPPPLAPPGAGPPAPHHRGS